MIRREVMGARSLRAAAEARAVAREVAGAVEQWKEVARGLGAAAAECHRMASAFEHGDFEVALEGP